MNLMGAFGRTVIRKAIEEQLPTWIGTLAELSITWIERCTPSDVERVAGEMTSTKRADQFRRMVAAVKGNANGNA
jgi:hypothetical protein